MKADKGALGVAGALVAAPAAALGYIAAIAPSGTGYKAQTACAAVFISGRDPATLESAEFAGLHPLLGFIHPAIDRDRREVRASLLGLGAQKSVFRPGLGCTLADPDATLPPAPAALAAPRRSPDDAIARGVAALPAGIVPARLDAFADAVFAEPDRGAPRHARALLVVWNGTPILERYAPGFGRDTPLAGYSMTKTLTGALIAILADRGRIRLDAPAPVAEWRQPGDPRGAITVDQLLHMTSGMRWSEDTDDPLSPVLKMMYHRRDAAAFAAGLALAHPPGSRFQYNSGSTNILARIARLAMHDDSAYLALPRTAIFDRIGMASAVIAPDASGTLIGSAQGFATARDWARFGELYRNGGVWNGQQVLPPGWVDRAGTPSPASQARGYGAQIWVNRAVPGQPERRPRPRLPADTLLMNGQFGQLTAVVPSRGLVVVRLGETHGWNFADDPDRLVADILAVLPRSPGRVPELAAGSSRR